MASLPKVKVGQQSVRHRTTCTNSPNVRYLNHREKHWNNRFYVDRMKEFKDFQKLSLYYKLKFLDPRIKSGTVKMVPANSRTNNEAERLESSEGSRASERSVFKLKIELKKAWEENKVIESHRNAFMRALEFCSIKRARKQIKRELKHNESKRSSVFALMRATGARENCLRKVLSAFDDLRAGLKPEDRYYDAAPYAQLSAPIQNLIKDYLQLTVFSIESLLKWRSEMQKLLRRDKVHKYHVRYQLNGENYLERIVKDNQYLCKVTGVDLRDIFFVGFGLLNIVRVRGWQGISQYSQLILVEEGVLDWEVWQGM